jgi:hypothetical protein
MNAGAFGGLAGAVWFGERGVAAAMSSRLPGGSWAKRPAAPLAGSSSDNAR